MTALPIIIAGKLLLAGKQMWETAYARLFRILG